MSWINVKELVGNLQAKVGSSTIVIVQYRLYPFIFGSPN